MIPAAFDYHAPASLDEALRLLRELPDAKVLAGGHSLLPMMKLRVVSPGNLVDLARIPDLRDIREDGNHLVIGAMTTHWMIISSPLVGATLPLLAEAAASIGDIQVRNLGTIGGSLVHADPAADYPAAVLALEAEMVVVGPRGRRAIAGREFFTGVLSTAVEPDEILVEVRVPVLPVGTGAAYLKFPHPASGFAVVGVAAVVSVENGRFQDVRVGITGVGPVAYRAEAVERALRGQSADAETVARAAEHAADGVDANQDIFATAEYRRHLAGVFTKRAILKVIERLGGGLS